MTRRTNAGIAGAAFLLYIAIGITSLVVFGRATKADGVAATLTAIAGHETEVRITVLLNLLTCFAALTLGVTTWAITRDEDRDLAMLGLACRVGEGLIGGVAIQNSLGLLWLATTGAMAAPEMAHGLSAYLMGQRWSPVIAGMFFAVGSTLFCYLLLRGRMIPAWLAWLGVVSSLLLVIGLPLRILGVLHGLAANLLWAPMAAFEIPFAVWLLVKGVAPPRNAAQLDAPA